MGSSQSSTSGGQQQQQQQQFQTLSSLLRLADGNDATNWNDVRNSLQQAPDQACLYAHQLEASHLFVALTKPSCPVDIVELLIDAYEDALDHDYKEQSVLHAACVSGGDNADIVKLLLAKRPNMAKTVNANCGGTLPLHHCRTVGVAEALLQVYPEAVTRRTRSGGGSLPLHCVLLDALAKQDTENEEGVTLDVDLCQLLMESASTASSNHHHHRQDGGLLIRNKKGRTPLALMIRLLDRSMQAVQDTADDDVNDETSETKQNFVDKLWDLLISHCLPRLMQKQQNDRHSDSDQQQLELHTLIEYACCHSQTLMDRALQDFSDQASMRDALGRTPLHIAAHIGSCCSTEALASLIRANPKAPRMTDNEGRLPIDWAAESPHTPLRNLSLLIQGEPRAIDTRDLRDGHFPFVSAAIAEHTSVGNTYALLRAKPHVLSYFHTP